MSSWIDIQANRERLQDALNRKLDLSPPLAIDGNLGTLSMKALRAAYAKYHVTDSIYFDSRILPYLLTPKEPTMADSTIISGAIASAEDYFLNFISSKINWTAGVMVGVLVTFVSTKFGFSIPPDTAQWLTVEISGAFAAIIVLLRTFLNRPKVIAGTSVTVVK